MAASLRPRAKTGSTSIPEASRATHVFKVAGYGLQKGLDQGAFVRSATFSVGGFDWCICYYPHCHNSKGSRDQVSVYLELQSKDTVAMAMFDLRLLNQVTGTSWSVYSKTEAVQFRCPGSEIYGASRFWKKSELEWSPYLRDDCLVIECDITVPKGPRLEDNVVVVSELEVKVPPPDLSDDLGKLLASGDGADVTFAVKGETFRCHKIVLAMRSPVFKAELYGPVGDNGTNIITIQDMEPAAFKALLNFVYTDSLPAMDDLDRDEYEEMIKHLLEAADRYGMERMRLTCENLLSKRLGVDSVATTLAIADRHHCSRLKDSCIAFINRLDKIDEVVASKGYDLLKRSCPSVFVDIWEKASKSRKV